MNHRNKALTSVIPHPATTQTCPAEGSLAATATESTLSPLRFSPGSDSFTRQRSLSNIRSHSLAEEEEEDESAFLKTIVTKSEARKVLRVFKQTCE